MNVLAVHTGAVADLPWGKRSVRSAFVKCTRSGPVAVGPLGLEGDEQADTAKHGGPDKSVCVFPSEHYAAFAAKLGRPLEQPAFGENLTLEGLTEDAVCIGDVLRIGTTVFEVSLPRNPCFKVGARHGDKAFVLWMEASGHTGFYLRVLERGTVTAGDAVELVARPHPQATVAEANRVMHHDKRDWPAIEALLAVPQLATSWRTTFERRLQARAVEDPTRRRYGVPNHLPTASARPASVPSPTQTT